MENKKLEKMMDVLVEVQKALKMKKKAEVFKIVSIGWMFASATLYATSKVCKISEGLHFNNAMEILDELKKEEEE